MSTDRSALEEHLTRASAEAQHELQRFLAEAEFVEGLCELHPENAAAWQRRLAKAEALVSAAAARGGVQGLRRAVREAEDLLRPAGKLAKTYTIYCAGHAHIDMNWMWSWPETVAVTHDTFGTVLRLMDEYPEFCFSQSQASVYALLAQYNPEMLARIRQRVAEGRWEVTASHWVEGDKNMAGGEALCRHLLYTRRFMQELFGLAPEDVAIDWSPDTFGHAATLPTYLVRGGVRHYYCCRPGQGKKFPPVFWWQAPDGSRVLVNREITWYNGVLEPRQVKDLLRFAKETGLREWLNVYGVGDHGGGPTRRDIVAALDMDTWPLYPRVKLSPTKPYFAMLEQHAAQFPTVTGELNFEFTGCYTSQSLIKKSNRLAETQLAAAEATAALASGACGREYPARALREAWQDTLFCHFHDILPGSCVHDARTYAHGLFQKTVALTGMVETQALRALAAQVDTRGVLTPAGLVRPPTRVRSAVGAGAGYGTGTGQLSAAEQTAGQGPRPFVIFNPCASPRGGAGVVTVWDNNPAEGWDHRALGRLPFCVRTPAGRRLPAQVVTTGDFWGHLFVKLAFPLETLPGFGYGLYTITQETAPAAEPAVKEVGRFGFENELVKVEIDPVGGGVCSLLHKASGVDVADAARPAALLEYAVERPHRMSAWTLAETGPVAYPDVVSITRKARGPHVAATEVKLRQGDSTFTVTYELRAGDPQLSVRIESLWVERGSREGGVPVLRAAFPLALEDASARYEIPFGALDRSERSGEEVPALRWAQVQGKAGGKRAGCLLLNDSKHGHSLDGRTLRLTLIRSSDEPDPLPEVGQHEIQLALMPFAGDLPAAEAGRQAAAHVNALRVVGTDIHDGAWPGAGAFLTLAPETLVLSGLKQAEDGSGLVLRFYETAGRATTARVTADATLLGRIEEAQELDVLERPLTESSAKVRGGAATVSVPAYGLVTLKLKLHR